MYKVAQLSNGIQILMEKIENNKSLAIGVYVKTGSKYEKDGEYGLSHFLEHMVFKGTDTRTALEISEAIDRIGGHMNAFTSKEVTGYYVSLLSSYIETGFDVLSDMLLNSNFTEENIKKEKSVVIEEIKMYEDVPEDKIHDMNCEYAIKGNCANSVLGSIESVSSITRDKLLEYYSNKYTTDNMIISVAGNFEEETILSIAEKYFGALNRKESKTKEKFDFSLANGNNIVKKDINQIHLCVNTKGTSYLNDNRYVLSIISNILGGNMSSRLFQKIREDKGLAYSVYTYLSSYYEDGMFTAYAGTTKDNYLEVIEMIKEEFNSIKESGITAAELDKAKNQLLSSLILGLETSKARMSRMANSYLNFGRIVEMDELIEKVKRIELDDIKKVAAEVFSEEHYSISILGDI